MVLKIMQDGGSGSWQVSPSMIEKINQTLEKALKASKSDSKIQKKIEGVKRPGKKSKQ